MDLRPMLATLADAPLQQKGLVYEPKYDGIRALVLIARARGGAQARIWSRNGNEKTAQFPEVVRALEAAGARLKAPVVLDGEIVALDERGRPAGFQRLQGRMHLLDSKDVARAEEAQPAVFIAFDILQDGKDDLTRLPLTERRKRLDKLFRSFHLKAEGSGKAEGTIRLSEQVAGDARAMYARAKDEGWEGLIAKEAGSYYEPGRRTPAWRKIKLLHEQEFVVGGWTEPRQTRTHFGALLLGVYENGVLKHAGHTGTGFDQKELARVSKLLKARETKQSPFSEPIKTNEPAHWVRPDLVAQVRFTEWTSDHKLRHPVYLGLRDDKRPREVVRETPATPDPPAPSARPPAPSARPHAPSARPHAAFAEPPAASAEPPAASAELPAASAELPAASAEPHAAFARPHAAFADPPAASAEPPAASAEPPVASAEPPVASAFRRKNLDAVVDQLRALEDARRDGIVTLPGGDTVKVTNLAKLFWPKLKITKGDLFRYDVEVSPFILPAVADRPLVMKRFPNGVGGQAFYQHKVAERGSTQFVGGSLGTLLEMTQLAAISQDPWFSRVQSPHEPDHAAIDLDPTEGATFDRVLDVARWVRDELESLGVTGYPKTSGASGLHVYIPLPPHTSYESGMLFCQIVATVVATKHPKVATVERTVARRPRGTVYLDYLQNIEGKTLATAYSARASDYAGVSTPLTWKEVAGKVDPRDFTIRTAPERFRAVGDLWAGLRTGAPADLQAVLDKYR
jgi:bifunctional non-homologous end joining protein LigD